MIKNVGKKILISVFIFTCLLQNYYIIGFVTSESEMFTGSYLLINLW
jgi:hypothetical protein